MVSASSSSAGPAAASEAGTWLIWHAIIMISYLNNICHQIPSVPFLRLHHASISWIGQHPCQVVLRVQQGDLPEDPWLQLLHQPKLRTGLRGTMMSASQPLCTHSTFNCDTCFLRHIRFACANHQIIPKSDHGMTCVYLLDRKCIACEWPC